MEGLIFGGAYLRREIYVSKSIGLACSGKEIYHFCFVLLCIRGQIPSTSPPGGVYSDDFWGLTFGGAYRWRGLFSEFYGMCNKFFSRVLQDSLILRSRRRFFRAKEVISRTREGKNGEEIPSTLRVFLSRGLQAKTRYHSESKVG